MIKRLWLKISSNALLKKIIESLCFVFFGVYIFSIGAFSGRSFFNYFSIAIGLSMIFLMFTYVVFFGRFKFDLFTVLLVNFSFSFLISNLINLSFLSFPKSVFTQSLMSFAMYQFFTSVKKERIKLLLPIMTFAGLAFLFLYFFHYRSEIIMFNFKNRLGSYFDNENEVAKEFGYLGIVAFCGGIYGGKYFGRTPKLVSVLFRLICFFAWLLFLFAVLTTGSISNLLTLLLVTFLAALSSIKKAKHKIAFIVSIFVFVVVLLLVFQLPSMSYFNKRLMKIINTFINGGVGGDASSNLRLYAIIQYVQLFFLRPLFGFGYGQGKMYTAYNMVAHSTIAELLTCVGLYGFLSFELILILPFVLSKKRMKEYCISFILLYVIVFQLFISSVYHAKFEFVFVSMAFAACHDRLGFNATVARLKAFVNHQPVPISSVEFAEISI